MFLGGEHQPMPGTVDEKRSVVRQPIVKFQSSQDKGKILQASRKQNRPQIKERESDGHQLYQQQARKLANFPNLEGKSFPT